VSLRGEIERGGGCLGGRLSLDAVRFENDGEKREGGGPLRFGRWVFLEGGRGGVSNKGARREGKCLLEGHSEKEKGERRKSTEHPKRAAG